MTSILKLGVAAFLSTVLVACGGTSYEDRLLERIEDGDRLTQRVNAMAPSGPRVVDNTTGSASFSGVAAIIAGPANDGAILIGDADVIVDFDGATDVSGSITNLGGEGNFNLNDDSSGDISSYSGVITLSNGSVGNGNQVEVDYAGTLRGNGDTIVLNGNMAGGFSGNPQIRAITIGGIDSAQYNGVRTDAFVGVIAERN